MAKLPKTPLKRASDTARVCPLVTSESTRLKTFISDLDLVCSLITCKLSSMGTPARIRKERRLAKNVCFLTENRAGNEKSSFGNLIFFNLENFAILIFFEEIFFLAISNCLFGLFMSHPKNFLDGSQALECLLEPVREHGGHAVFDRQLLHFAGGGLT